MNEQKTKPLSDLTLENNNLVYALANRLGSHGVKEDLFQVGHIGIIKAHQNFQRNKGVKFSTYAYKYIQGEMKKYLREDRGVKVSRELIYLSARIERARDLITQKLRREPTTYELATYLEIDEYDVIEALQMRQPVKSIDEPVNSEGKEITIKDIIYASESYDQLDLICLREALEKLSPNDQKLIEMRYWQDKTQFETASMLHMSQVQVSRGEQKILNQLKNNIYH